MQVVMQMNVQVNNYISDNLLKEQNISNTVVDGMQSGDETVISPEALRPLIMRSLRRSSVRKKIADYLFEISPSGSYTSDIAYNVKTTPTNVIGALRGMNSRYRDDESLLSLNLVEMIESGKNVKIYKLTDLGKDIIQSMKERK